MEQNKSLKIKGVNYDKNRDYWRGTISINGKRHQKIFQVYLYDDARESAIRWRKQKEKEKILTERTIIMN